MTAGPVDPAESLLSVHSVDEAVDAYVAAGLRPILIHAPVEGGGCSCGKVHDVTASGSSSAGKHPISPNWQKTAFTVDELHDQIARLSFTPNVGIVLGKQPNGSYLVAVDVDDVERFAKLEAELGALPETPRCDSGRGYRLFYSLPPEIDAGSLRNVTALGGEPGVDVKVEGGQVVVAPSLHANGKRYVWTRVGAIAPLPLEWATTLTNPRARREKLPQGTQGKPLPSRARGDREPPYFSTALDRETLLLSQTQKGARHNRLNESLCRMLPLARGLGVADSRVTDALASAARSTGLPLWEIESIVRSALAWADRSHAIRVPDETPDRLVYVSEVYVESKPAQNGLRAWGVIKITIRNYDGSLVFPIGRPQAVLPLPGYETSRPRYDAIVGAEIDPWDVHRGQGPFARALLVGRELSAAIRDDAMPVAERTGRNLRADVDAMLVEIGDAAIAEKCHVFLREKDPRNLFAAHVRLIEVCEERGLIP